MIDGIMQILSLHVLLTLGFVNGPIENKFIEISFGGSQTDSMFSD